MPNHIDIPGSIRSLEELEDRLSAPWEQLIEGFGRREGDVMILGAGGKMGPSLARMAQRACQMAGGRRRVFAASRFSDAAKRQALEACGVHTIACDLLDESALAGLPAASEVVYLAGMKFGATSQEPLVWALNAHLPGLVCRRYRDSRVAAFSTGNVYGLSETGRGGSREEDPPRPAGEYAMSCLGRERIFEYYSRAAQLPVAIIRLNYACEMRYGVLVDLARRVLAGEPIDLAMGWFNIIWQGDANALALLLLERAAAPALTVNLTGPELLSVREVALEFGRWLGKEVRFQGREAATALLSNAARLRQWFGPPRVDAGQLIRWIADWVKRGGAALQMPTHFEVRDGKY